MRNRKTAEGTYMVKMASPSKGSLSDVVQELSLTNSPVRVMLSNLFIICAKKVSMFEAEQVDGKQTAIFIISDVMGISAMQYFPCIL